MVSNQSCNIQVKPENIAKYNIPTIKGISIIRINLDLAYGE